MIMDPGIDGVETLRQILVNTPVSAPSSPVVSPKATASRKPCAWGSDLA
jgi:hypothetical protein